MDPVFGVDDPLFMTDAEIAQAKRIQQRASKRGTFVPPIPLTWFEVAARLPGKAALVAIAIRLQAALRRSDVVSLPNKHIKAFGLDAGVKRRALTALEQAGLIKVEHSPGCNPIVTIIEIEGKSRE